MGRRLSAHIRRTTESPWEPSQDQIITNKTPNPTEPMGKNFWPTVEDLYRLRDECATVSAWSFKNSLGDTIMEKYEALYVQLVEVQNMVISKGHDGYFWLVTGKEIASIFESATCGFCPPSMWEHECKGEEIEYRGIVHNRWRIFVCDKLPNDQILMGVDNYDRGPTSYARITVFDFII